MARQITGDVLETLIPFIYDAALDATQWQTVLTRIAGIHRGSALFYEEEPTGRGARLYAGVNIDPAWREPYETYYSRIKPWRDKLTRLPAGAVVRSSEWLDERGLRKTEYYNDCLRPLDLFYNLGIELFRKDQAHTAIALVRPYAVGDFTDDERSLCERLVPHLQRAAHLTRRLHAAAVQRDAVLWGLERLSIGVILAAGDGRVLFANHLAERALEREEGLSAYQQRLRAMTPELTKELLRRIREAADTGAGMGTRVSGALSLPRRSGDSVSLLVCPFPISAGVTTPSVPAALLFIGRSSGATTVRQSDLRQIYGLTIAEAKVVGALLAGATLRSYAAASGISAETAKTQLDQVFAKTGQRRQADLIRHILSNPIIQLARKEPPPQGRA